TTSSKSNGTAQLSSGGSTAWSISGPQWTRRCFPTARSFSGLSSSFLTWRWAAPGRATRTTTRSSRNTCMSTGCGSTNDRCAGVPRSRLELKTTRRPEEILILQDLFPDVAELDLQDGNPACSPWCVKTRWPKFLLIALPLLVAAEAGDTLFQDDFKGKLG